MNAHEKGEQAGFTTRLLYPGTTRATFQKLAWANAKRWYNDLKKQTDFVDGFLARYQEPHAKDCDCEQCKRAQAEILTF